MTTFNVCVCVCVCVCMYMGVKMYAAMIAFAHSCYVYLAQTYKV